MNVAVRDWRLVSAVAADLGRRVAGAWSLRNYDQTVFPAVAEEELQRRSITSEIDWMDLVEWVVRSDELPFQQFFDSQFGEPPLTLYWHPRFFIQILFWASNTTAVHSHAFAGAFTVLEGSSLQSLYGFSCTHRINEQMRLGVLQVGRTTVLQRGTVQQILQGEAFIHSVFHLDFPSVTLVVRTHADVDPNVRIEYHRPHVAFAPAFEDQQRTRRLQCLALVAKTRPSEYDALACELVRTCDLSTAFFILQREYLSSRQGSEPSTTMLAGRSRFPDWMDRLEIVFTEMRRQAIAHHLRRVVTDADLRFFLGLLLTQTSADTITKLVSDRVGHLSPASSIAGWTQRLAEARALPFSMDGLAVDVLIEMMTCRTADPATVWSALQRRGPCSTSDEAGVKERAEQLGKSLLLAPLFVRG